MVARKKMKLNSALAQVVLVGLISFCCPGLFNAMQGLGGAGGKNADSGNAANTALYTTFAIFGYFGGPVFNLIGNKLCMCLGGLTYGVYAICMYVVGNTDGAGWLAPAAGVILGCGAGIFWTAQGAMMLAYSTKENKGWYISIFWIIFNLGGLAGGLMAFGLNFHEESGQAKPSLYFTFCALMCLGAFMALTLLASPGDVVRDDGKLVEVDTPETTAWEDIKGAIMAAGKPEMMLLACTFVSSNWYYTYQLNYLNGWLFNIRTRGLNSSMYWAIQMVGAYIAGMLLDAKRAPRARAFSVYFLVQVSFIIFWVGASLVQYRFENGYDKDVPLDNRVDLTESSRACKIIFVFIVAGFSDACLQAFSYWMIGSLARGDTMLSARYTGFYKGLQSAGAAVAWALDLKISYKAQLWTSFSLWALAAVTSIAAIRRLPNEMPAELPDEQQQEQYFAKTSTADELQQQRTQEGAVDARPDFDALEKQ